MASSTPDDPLQSRRPRGAVAQPPASATTTVRPHVQEFVLLPLKQLRFVGALARDPRVSARRKILYAAVIGMLVGALLVPDGVIAVLVATLLPLVGPVIAVPADATVGWLLVGAVAYALFRLFPPHVVRDQQVKCWVVVTCLLLIAGILGGCDTGLVSTAVPTGSSGASCAVTDQNQYVYHPDRLQVVQPCLRVSGVVDAVRDEADGDKHVLLHLDPPYQQLLQPANQNEQGDLVVEPVCVGQVTQQDAVDVCASDPDPYAAPLPAVGDHVWMEGRYVYDLDHGGWAELHPLYRSGPVSS